MWGNPGVVEGAGASAGALKAAGTLIGWFNPKHQHVSGVVNPSNANLFFSILVLIRTNPTQASKGVKGVNVTGKKVSWQHIESNIAYCAGPSVRW